VTCVSVCETHPGERRETEEKIEISELPLALKRAMFYEQGSGL